MDDNFQFNPADIPTPPLPLTPGQVEDLSVWVHEQHRLKVQTSGEPPINAPNLWDSHWARGGAGRSYFTKR